METVDEFCSAVRQMGYEVTAVTARAGGVWVADVGPPPPGCGAPAVAFWRGRRGSVEATGHVIVGRLTLPVVLVRDVTAAVLQSVDLHRLN